MARRNLLLIAGPSGVGKGTLINMLMADAPGDYGFSVSHTTRDPRTGEKDGVHYHFVSTEEFEELLGKKAFVEYAHVHHNYYGTSKTSVDTVREAGQACILDVDVQGAQQVHDAKMGFFKIFVKPPSVEALRERLVGRGTETAGILCRGFAYSFEFWGVRVSCLRMRGPCLRRFRWVQSTAHYFPRKVVSRVRGK